MNDDNKNIQKTIGYLEKRGKLKIINSWKKYWFVLEGHLLLYYASKDDYDSISPCRGSISLGPQCTVKPYSSAPLGFQITTRSTTFTLRAENQADQTRWMQAILFALNQNQTPNRSPTNLTHFRYSMERVDKINANHDSGKERQSPVSPGNLPFHIQDNELIERLQRMGARSYSGRSSVLEASRKNSFISKQGIPESDKREPQGTSQFSYQNKSNDKTVEEEVVIDDDDYCVCTLGEPKTSEIVGKRASETRHNSRNDKPTETAPERNDDHWVYISGKDKSPKNIRTGGRGKIENNSTRKQKHLEKAEVNPKVDKSSSQNEADALLNSSKSHDIEIEPRLNKHEFAEIEFSEGLMENEFYMAYQKDTNPKKKAMTQEILETFQNKELGRKTVEIGEEINSPKNYKEKPPPLIRQISLLGEQYENNELYTTAEALISPRQFERKFNFPPPPITDSEKINKNQKDRSSIEKNQEPVVLFDQDLYAIPSIKEVKKTDMLFENETYCNNSGFIRKSSESDLYEEPDLDSDIYEDVDDVTLRWKKDFLVDADRATYIDIDEDSGHLYNKIRACSNSGRKMSRLSLNHDVLKKKKKKKLMKKKTKRNSKATKEVDLENCKRNIGFIQRIVKQTSNKNSDGNKSRKIVDNDVDGTISMLNDLQQLLEQKKELIKKLAQNGEKSDKSNSKLPTPGKRNNNTWSYNGEHSPDILQDLNGGPTYTSNFSIDIQEAKTKEPEEIIVTNEIYVKVDEHDDDLNLILDGLLKLKTQNIRKEDHLIKSESDRKQEMERGSSQ